MEYEVIITETLSRRITVEANSREDALDIVQEKYANEEIILDSNDFFDVEFDALYL